MSDRIRKSWKVLSSIESSGGDFCVDFFIREDGSFGFEEFRRDVEDMGKWTGINYYSVKLFQSQEDAMTDAREHVWWLNDLLERRGL